MPCSLQCMPLGSDTKSKSLPISFTVLPTDIEIEVSRDSVQINDTVTLTCGVVRSIPPAVIHVTRTDKPGELLHGTTRETKNQDGTFRVETQVNVPIMDKVPRLTYQCSVMGINVKKQKSINIYCEYKYTYH